ncbi:MAG: sterol desaturase family protein [Gammaproteobacteria bacterium]
MEQIIGVNEAFIRLEVFAFMVAVLSLWEWWRPRRGPFRLLSARRAVNALMLVVNVVVVRLVLVSSLVGVEVLAQNVNFGILKALSLAPAASFVVTLLALDLVVYLQHRLFHVVPWLWRMHAVHHSDVDFDLTTGVRFHPGEIIVSTVIKGAAVVLLGAAPLAVLVFEAVLSSASLFTHANARMPSFVDTLLRWVLVTPDMHRIHHSVDDDEHNHNFGFCLTWWDRLLGSYRAQPRAPLDEMAIGLDAFRDPSDQRLARFMTQPVRTMA